MKSENVALGFAVGSFFLAILSFFLPISVQILTTFSAFSMLFSLSQALRNYLKEKGTEHKAQFDAYSKVGNVNMDEATMLLFRKYPDSFIPNKCEKRLKWVANIVECLSFAVFILGLVIPIPFFNNPHIGTTCTILSFTFLFVSIWLVGYVQERSRQWEDIQIYAMLMQNQSNTAISVQEDNHGQA